MTVSYALHFSECTRGYAFRFPERVSKVIPVPEAAPFGALSDRAVGIEKKSRRLPDSDVRQILLISKTGDSLKLPGEIGGAHMAQFRHPFNVNGFWQWP